MGNYTYRFNPISGEFDIVQDTSLITLKGVVDTTGDLPLSGNSENDTYIVKADDRMYTWNKATPDGILSDWLDIGSVSEIDWSVITNRPTSVVGDIDDAVTKRHTQGTDTTLGAMSANLDMNDNSILNLKDSSIQFKSGGSLTRDDYLDSITKKHEQNTDQKLMEIVDAWVEVAPQLGTESRIYSLAVYNGKLYGGTYPNGKLYEFPKMDEVIVTDIKDAISKKHTQNTDTGTSNNFDVTGEISIKLYSQNDEPTLGQDNRIAIWIDTDDSNRVYLLYRRGVGDQVAVELA